MYGTMWTTTYDGTTLRLYVDGAEVGFTDTALVLNTIRPLRVGAGNTDGTMDFYFNGKIDDTRVYDRVLSAFEITDLYFSTPTPTPTPTRTPTPTLTPTITHGDRRIQ